LTKIGGASKKPSILKNPIGIFYQYFTPIGFFGKLPTFLKIGGVCT